jgi:hypothetical protein
VLRTLRLGRAICSRRVLLAGVIDPERIGVLLADVIDRVLLHGIRDSWDARHMPWQAHRLGLHICPGVAVFLPAGTLVSNKVIQAAKWQDRTRGQPFVSVLNANGNKGRFKELAPHGSGASDGGHTSVVGHAQAAEATVEVGAL